MQAQFLLLLAATIAIAVFNETESTTPNKTEGLLSELVARHVAKAPDVNLYWDRSAGAKLAKTDMYKVNAIKVFCGSVLAATILIMSFFVVKLALTFYEIVVFRMKQSSEVPSRIAMRRYGTCEEMQ